MNDETSSEGLVKISFECGEDERVGSVKTETLWAEPVEGDLYRIRNVPIYVYGFSEYDVVSATRRDDRLMVTGVASRNGHFTYRVFLPEDTSAESFLKDRFSKKSNEWGTGLSKKDIADTHCDHQCDRPRRR